MRAALALIAVIVLFAEPVRSQVVHEISFEIAPIVEVWETAAPAPGKASFAVASNTGFEILAASPAAASARDLAAANFRLTLAGTGPNAAALGATVAEDTPDGVIVYRARARTAAERGAPESQAVAFIASWDDDRLPEGVQLAVRPTVDVATD